MKIVGVRFHEGGRVYHFDPGKLNLEKEDMVVVDTAFGNESGKVVYVEEIDIKEAKAKEKELMPVIRKFTKEDYEIIEEEEKEKKKYMETARKAVGEAGLEMKILDASFGFDGKKLTFIFSSDSRVDFRALVKDLSKKLKKQIVLRQIGPRDEARLLGGFGRCGRRLCCQTFLQDLESITMDMAKVQNMAGKGSSKISGICGKLMCCLSYEVDTYKKLIKNIPAIGSKIKTKKGQGVVIDQNILKQTVLVELDKDHTRIEVEVGRSKK